MSKKLLLNNVGENSRLKVRYTNIYSDTKLPTFNSDFVYEVNIIDSGDGTYTREIYSDDDFTSVKFGSGTYPSSVDYLAITNKVTSLKDLFKNCSNLEYVNATNWDTSNVTNMNSVFGSCYSLVEIKGFENWNIHKVTDIINLFSGCKLKSIDLSKWDLSNVSSAYMVLYNCKSLESVKIPSLNTRKAAVLNNFFYGCESLKSIDLSNWIFSQDHDIYLSSFFGNCKSLTEIKGFENVNVYNAEKLFYGCESLTSLDLSTLVIEEANTMMSMFQGYSSLTEIKGIENFVVSNVRRLDYTFSNCISLTSLDLSSWDVSKVTNMYNTFYNCPYLTTLGDISNWDVSSVTDMGGLFRYCSSLELPSLGSWDTSSVTDMSYLFEGKSNQSIDSLYIHNWNTGNVTNMSYMFNNFRDVQNIYINNWSTSNLSNVENMFLDCQTNAIYVSPDFQYTEEDTGYSGSFINE